MLKLIFPPPDVWCIQHRIHQVLLIMGVVVQKCYSPIFVTHSSHMGTAMAQLVQWLHYRHNNRVIIVWFQEGTRNSSLLPNEKTISAVQQVSCLMGNMDPAPGKRWPRHKAVHLPPPSAKIKNEWSLTSNSPRYLHGMLKDNFTITFTIYSSHTGNKDNCTRTSALSSKGKGSTGEIWKKEVHTKICTVHVILFRRLNGPGMQHIRGKCRNHKKVWL
jgi:hypothetical protein